MTDKEIGGGSGADLWRKARGPVRAALGDSAAPDAMSPDAMTLAAYLDGALDEVEAAPIEAWLARDPEALDDLIAARQILAEAPGPVPAGVAARAQDIVRARVPRAAVSGGSGFGLSALFGGLDGLLRPAVWAGAAALLVLASVSGFELGRAGVEHLASLDATVSQDLLLVMGRTGTDLL
jgi:anti-sigma factor RsiW